MKKTSMVVLMSILVIMPMFASTASAKTWKVSPVTGLRAFDTTNTALTFAWTPKSGYSRYAIQMSTSKSFSKRSTHYATGATSKAKATFRWTSLKPSTTYYARIRATTAGSSPKDVSDWSKTAKVRTSSYAHSAPKSLKLSSVYRTGLTFSWSEIPNTGSYRVRYSTSSKFTSNVKYVYPTDNVVKVAGLTPGTKYYFSVRALESKRNPADGNNYYLLTAYSSTVSATTTSTITHAPVTGLSLQGTAGKKVIIRWKPIPGATVYRIEQWQTSTARRYTSTNALTPSEGSFDGTPDADGYVVLKLNKFCDMGTKVCSGFAADKAYTFRVATYGDVGSMKTVNIAGYSSPLVVTVSSLPLTEPSDFRADKVTSSTIALSWKKVDGATSYRIQQRKTSSATSSPARYLYDVCKTTGAVDSSIQPTCSYDSSTNRYSITLKYWADTSTRAAESIKAKTNYYFKISSALPSGTKGAVTDTLPLEDRASNYVASYRTVKTAAYKYSPPPLRNDGSHSTSIDIKWGVVSGAKAYQLQRNSKPDFTGSSTYYCTASAGKTVGSLGRETTYYFRVRVMADTSCKTAASDWSAGITARTLEGTASITGKVRGSSAGISTMAAVAYLVGDSQTGDSTGTGGATRVSSDGSWTITGLRPGTYKVFLSQIGDQNFTSPWVNSQCAGVTAECHKLMSQAQKLTVKSGVTLNAGTTDIATGLILSGAVKSGSSPLSKVDVSAVGAPQKPTDKYREVQGSDESTAQGAYRISGLMPGKYRVDAVKSGYKKWSKWFDYLEKISGSTNIAMVR